MFRDEPPPSVGIATDGREVLHYLRWFCASKSESAMSSDLGNLEPATLTSGKETSQDLYCSDYSCDFGDILHPIPHRVCLSLHQFQSKWGTCC